MTLRTIRVRPVDGRTVLHPATGARISEPVVVEQTSYILRALRRGDLEPAPEAAQAAPRRAKADPEPKQG